VESALLIEEEMRAQDRRQIPAGGGGLPRKRDARHQRSNRQGLAIEANHFARMVPTRDIEEGLSAWLERRKPQFTGC
jgi:hypothetical protein